ncbi:MAG TPA: MBL fold metallo-hydrolase [Bacillota bacterium]|nr:MBL fold metallo-hydrolase [Bacillota bacterium]
MIFEWLPVGPMGANCYILGCEKTKAGAIIDPGAEPKRILAKVAELGLKVEYIIMTHGHIDHIMALGEVKEATSAKIVIHKSDAPMLTDGRKNLSSFMGGNLSYPPADELVKDGDVLRLGELELKILHTPGHTTGGICIEVGDILISGDTLFECSVGRSDFPGGSHSTLINSINTKLMVYPDETKVFPGHGPGTTIGYERKNNPFLRM